MSGVRRPIKAAIAAGVLAGFFVPEAARVEGTTILAPFFTAGMVYDDNIFSSSSRPEKDLFLRDTPGIQWTFRRPNLTIEGRYLFDAEFYGDHSQLDSYHARQLASVGMQRFRDRFTTLSAGVTFAETLRPGDLVQATGLDLGRARSRAYSASLGLEKRTSPTESWGAGYDYTLLMFGQEENAGTHLLTGSWGREFGSFNSVTLRAGPRFFQGDIDPELSASVER